MKNPKTSKKFSSWNKVDQEWVLTYLSTGKGTIPYQLVTEFDSFSISPGKHIFEGYLFYSKMKDSTISSEDYQNVKKFYTLLKLSDLGELSRLYNFQDTIILSDFTDFTDLRTDQNY